MVGLLHQYVWPNQYRYYDSPEGQDCIQKFMYVEKYLAIYGTALASLDVLLFSHPKGYPATLARYAYITAPIMGMGAAFVSITCLATNLRKKDDRVNYVLGGAAGGSILGLWQKSVKVGIHGAMWAAGLALLHKDFIMRGWDMFPNPDTHVQMFRDGRTDTDYDFSVFKDPGSTWKASLDQ